MRYLISFIACVIFFTGYAVADGRMPPVNSDLYCTTFGHHIYYDFNSNAVTCGTLRRISATVGTLPVCNAAMQGALYLVTDALTQAPLAQVQGGGNKRLGVTCDGNGTWIVQ